MSNTGDNAELIELLRDKSEDGSFSDFERHLFLKSAQAITAADARIASLESNINRLTSNPADHRYWEGRYRDEAARAETAEARIAELEERLAINKRAADVVAWAETLPELTERMVTEAQDIDSLTKALASETLRAETAETLLEEARRALAPFIRLADNVFSDGKNATVADEVTLWCFNDTDITFGDLRRARACKSNVEGKELGAEEAGQDAAKSPA